jgi:hypothetical protein
MNLLCRSNQEEEVLQHLDLITLHQAAKSKRRRRSGDGGGMFGLSGDDAGQVVVEEEERRRKLGGAGRNSHEVMLHAFATPELFTGPVGDGGGYPVESSLLMQQQGSIAAASSSMVDSSSELTTEGNVCGIGSAGAASSDGSLELRVGASTTLMDMLPGQTIIAAHDSQQLSGLSPEVSPTVSGSSASTASGQNSGRVFSQLHLTGLDEKAFVSQEPSSVCAPTDSIGSSHAAAPYLGVKSSCALTGISGPAPAPVAGPTLFRFPGSQAVCEESNNIMMTVPDPMTAMLLRASFPSNCAAGDSSVEISGRPKRRNVRISKDPQSVAARHRRERISDRIRMLQRLVPGGTKMDTASMLDEAIHYVKFLKLQLQVQGIHLINPQLLLLSKPIHNRSLCLKMLLLHHAKYHLSNAIHQMLSSSRCKVPALIAIGQILCRHHAKDHMAS